MKLRLTSGGLVDVDFTGIRLTSGGLIKGSSSTLVQVLQPTKGQLNLTGNSPTLVQVLQPTKGQLNLTGNSPILLTILQPTKGQLNLTGNIPQIYIDQITSSYDVIQFILNIAKSKNTIFSIKKSHKIEVEL